MVQTRSHLEDHQVLNNFMLNVYERNTRKSSPPPPPRVEMATAHQKEQYDTNYAAENGGEANS